MIHETSIWRRLVPQVIQANRRTWKHMRVQRIFPTQPNPSSQRSLQTSVVEAAATTEVVAREAAVTAIRDLTWDVGNGGSSHLVSPHLSKLTTVCTEAASQVTDESVTKSLQSGGNCMMMNRSGSLSMQLTFRKRRSRKTRVSRRERLPL